MNIPFIAPIEGFAEMVDLLSNMPQLKQRLKDLHDLEEHVNGRIGTLDEVQTMRREKNQTSAKLIEAGEIKEAAIVEARAIVARGEAEYQAFCNRIKSEMAEYQVKMKELSESQTAVDRSLAENAALRSQLTEQETRMDAKLKEIVSRETLLNERTQILADKQKRTMEIWQ